ncbi:hypothetical protein RZP61_28490, partial [Klebsiella quasipneumoniae subsp. similipneumoniae]|uniref:hypothetical protein n=1 Tax=Klebsiella quasipneumoniae TaxID=1463165 RepID=UPI00292B7DD6
SPLLLPPSHRTAIPGKFAARKMRVRLREARLNAHTDQPVLALRLNPGLREQSRQFTISYFKGLQHADW